MSTSLATEEKILNINECSVFGRVQFISSEHVLNYFSVQSRVYVKRNICVY